MDDLETSTPLYRQIADSLAARITVGELRPGQPMPSEGQIQSEFGVSHGTARRAIADLRDRKLIITVPQ